MRGWDHVREDVLEEGGRHFGKALLAAVDSPRPKISLFPTCVIVHVAQEDPSSRGHQRRHHRCRQRGVYRGDVCRHRRWAWAGAVGEALGGVDFGHRGEEDGCVRPDCEEAGEEHGHAVQHLRYVAALLWLERGWSVVQVVGSAHQQHHVGAVAYRAGGDDSRQVFAGPARVSFVAAAAILAAHRRERILAPLGLQLLEQRAPEPPEACRALRVGGVPRLAAAVPLRDAVAHRHDSQRAIAVAVAVDAGANHAGHPQA